MDYPSFICKSILLTCLPFPSILTMKLRIKWRDHLSSEKTFKLLSLFWNFHQGMNFNAINQFNKIMRLELPFLSCGTAVQGAKCPGSWSKVICKHVCNSYSLTFFPYFPSAILGLAWATARFVQHRTSLIQRHHRNELGPSVTRRGEPAGTEKQRWTHEKHWGAVRRAPEVEVCERYPQKASARLSRPLMPTRQLQFTVPDLWGFALNWPGLYGQRLEESSKGVETIPCEQAF